MPSNSASTAITEGTPISMTDGGVETVLVFHHGFDLPAFAAFPLLHDPVGRAALRRYYDEFLAHSAETGIPFVFDTATWRANRDWGEQLGYSPAALRTANADAVDFVREAAEARPSATITVNGVLGPRGDGYRVTERMTADEAADYDDAQIEALADAGAERISALTLTYPEEAIGVVRAAHARGVEVVPSFTVETDGRLPDGTTLPDAIARLDDETAGAARFVMLNCAHPSHIEHGLGRGLGRGADARRPEIDRIGGLRFNASMQSHAELDEAEELDDGDPVALGRDAAALRALLPQAQVLGGCCGTDVRHVREIVAAW